MYLKVQVAQKIQCIYQKLNEVYFVKRNCNICKITQTYHNNIYELHLVHFYKLKQDLQTNFRIWTSIFVKESEIRLVRVFTTKY